MHRLTVVELDRAVREIPIYLTVVTESGPGLDRQIRVANEPYVYRFVVVDHDEEVWRTDSIESAVQAYNSILPRVNDDA